MSCTLEKTRVMEKAIRYRKLRIRRRIGGLLGRKGLTVLKLPRASSLGSAEGSTSS